MEHPRWTNTEYVQQIDSVTEDVVRAQLKRISANHSVELFVLGNVSETTALEIGAQVLRKFDACKVRPSAAQLSLERNIELSPGRTYVRQLIANNPNEMNSAVDAVYVFGVGDDIELKNSMEVSGSFALCMHTHRWLPECIATYSLPLFAYSVIFLCCLFLLFHFAGRRFWWRSWRKTRSISCARWKRWATLCTAA